MERPSPALRHRYWTWLAVALFLLLAVDLLTTLAAAMVVGAAGERNPVVALALQQGVAVLVLVNVVAGIAAAILYAGLDTLMERAPTRQAWLLARVTELWLVGLIVAGIIVATTNLAVIVRATTG